VNIVQSVLAKANQLLVTEPARLIGYSSAVVVYFVALFLTSRGLLPALTFDQSVAAAFGGIATLVIIVESARRFVYSPQTYIEDLADESQAAHELAHLEIEFQSALAAIKAEHEAAVVTKQPVAIRVGTIKAAGSGDKSN